MAKTKPKPPETPVIQISGSDRDYIIMEASIKDGFCNYSFEIIKGIGTGDTHGVKGSGLVMDDMHNAFSKLNVHLAAIDDVFKHAGIEVENIHTMHTDDLTLLYHVTGFKIKGAKDDESIILIGNKYVGSAGGRIELATPKIPLDTSSSYKWAYELKDAVIKARSEVTLYKEGKYQPVEVTEAEKPNPKQTKMKFEKPENGGDVIDQDDSDFNNAKV